MLANGELVDSLKVGLVKLLPKVQGVPTVLTAEARYFVKLRQQATNQNVGGQNAGNPAGPAPGNPTMSS
jgi:hypothetical protein